MFFACTHNQYKKCYTTQKAVALLLLFFSLFFVSSNAVLATECVKGDVKTGDGKCLYGSDSVPDGLGDGISNPKDNIRIAINIALGFLGVLVVIMVLYGGFLWLTSTGNEDRITKGRKTILWAAIGAIVISIAWTITSYILHIGQVVG